MMVTFHPGGSHRTTNALLRRESLSTDFSEDSEMGPTDLRDTIIHTSIRFW